MHIDLQRISLGALIIALGLLVDDAMTTVDAMIRRLAEGDDMESAASFAYRTLAFPMLTGTFITMAGFVPIGFARSAAGEYTFSIFAVVSIALVVSWFVAVLFTPLVGAVLLRKPKEATKQSDGGATMRIYRGFLLGALRARWLTILVTIGIFVASIVALSMVPRQFFPASDRVELLVDLRLPQNASIFASEGMVDRFESALRDDPDIERWSTYIGRGAIRFYLPLDVQLANPFFSQIVVVAKDIDARERLHARAGEEAGGAVSRRRLAYLAAGTRAAGRLAGAVSRERPGSRARCGRSRSVSRRWWRPIRNTRLTNFDWMEPARELRIHVDQNEARQLGVSSETLAQVLNAHISGTVVTQVRDVIYLIDVIARAAGGQSMSIATLRNLPVPLPNGRTIPLSQFATFEYGQEYPLVWRRDRVPTLTVQADVAPGILPETVVNDLAPEIDKLNAELPAGYFIALGGIAEESARSQASVAAVVPLMLLLMLSLLMIQLKSFQRMLMVLSVVPLGLIGVVGGLLASGRPLGFVAILGILSLMGMIARNAVILIEQIEIERTAGHDVWTSVVEASISRFRPIMLTAISTVLGLIPIAFTVFWGPMAFAVMGGMLVASLLTLIFLPALYVTWFGGRKAAEFLE